MKKKNMLKKFNKKKNYRKIISPLSNLLQF